MYVTPHLPDRPSGGRAQLSRLHHDSLASLLGPDLVLHELRAEGEQARTGIRALAGHIDGVSAATVAAACERVRRLGVDRVFIDGSNLGVLARALRAAAPGVEVLTFFHNVEARFFYDAARETKRPKALAVLAANYIAERLAARHSHRLLALSRRDSDELRRLYGRAATDILPMAVDDKLPPSEARGGRTAAGDYALFVGGAFFANVAGIRWYATRVAPRIGLRTCIVGRGLDEALKDLPRRDNVEVVGPAERLDGWYLDAKVVIAPIFGGSGMKTKVAEALMFGKAVIGTTEAFSGYEEVMGEAGQACETEDAFVEALRRVEREPSPRFNPALRSIYEAHYSVPALTRRLSSILSENAVSQMTRNEPRPGAGAPTGSRR